VLQLVASAETLKLLTYGAEIWLSITSCF